LKSFEDMPQDQQAFDLWVCAHNLNESNKRLQKTLDNPGGVDDIVNHWGSQTNPIIMEFNAETVTAAIKIQIESNNKRIAEYMSRFFDYDAESHGKVFRYLLQSGEMPTNKQEEHPQ
jgi:regulator of sigma D